MRKNNFSRRKFIGQLSCAAIGSNTFLNTLINLNLTNTVVAKRALFNNDYKALVCVLFSGGLDSFNMLVPKGTTEYNEYQQVRGSLSLPQANLLPITPNTSDGKTYGLHPSLLIIIKVLSYHLVYSLILTKSDNGKPLFLRTEIQLAGVERWQMSWPP